MPVYKLVPEHKGIEVYFDNKPNVQVIQDLKANGWKWHPYKKCWYSVNTPESKEYARKLCSNDESGSDASLAEQMDDGNNSFSQMYGAIQIHQQSVSGTVSVLSISRSSEGYSVSSTNNMMACVDCNKFFSIHANACPFCGCPSFHSADVYYKNNVRKLEEERVRQIEKMKMKQKEERERREQEYKDREIYLLKSKYSLSKFVSENSLRSENLKNFDMISSRIKKLASLVNLVNVSVEEWSKILRLPDYEYGMKYTSLLCEALLEKNRRQKLREIEEQRKDALKLLCAKHNLDSTVLRRLVYAGVSLKEVEKRMFLYKKYSEMHLGYTLQLCDVVMMSEEQIEQSYKEYIRKEAIKQICNEYFFSENTLNRLLESSTSAEELQRLISKIRYYQKLYPQYSIVLEKFVTKSGDDIELYIESMKKKNTYCTGNCSTCTLPHCVMN